ncbi:unnamed protein product [Adineta steineri]|uniref:Uncharacterized protein n=1 Tax=Adineta steineri TaxID=433720 RepID=A0A813WFW1_9BILA|nr:unnamed protein product [Adineta steineri]
MNKLLFVVAVLICIFVERSVSDGKFDFPAESCVTALTGNYVGCLGALAQSIWKVSQWGDATPITICGNQCLGNLKGRISKLKWKWDAKFQCQNKGQGIQGGSTALSRNGAMQGAIQDWITKAVQAGQINAADFKC